MAVTDYGGRRTLFDEYQYCYRISSGNRELRFGRGCIQTSAAVDGGRSFPPTLLFSGPSNRERRSRRWSAHQRSRSPPSLHRYHHLQPLSPPSSFSSLYHYHSHPPPSSSSSRHQNQTPQIHHYKKSRHRDQHPNPIFDSPHAYTTDRISIKPHIHFHTNPLTTLTLPSKTTTTHSLNQFPTCETQPTKIHVQQIPQIANPMKPSNRKYHETHKSQLQQVANTQDNSPQNHHDSFTSTRETQFTKTETQSHHTQLNVDSKTAFKDDFDHHYREGILGASTVLHKQTREATMTSIAVPSQQEKALGLSTNPTHDKGPNNSVVLSLQGVHAKGRIDSNELDISVLAQEDLCPKQINTSLCWPNSSPPIKLNSNKKLKPTFPKGKPTTLVDMMQFVSDWFDFEEGENDCCDVLGDIIVNCDNSVQEKGNHEQSGSQLGVNSKSPTRELTDSEPGFMISENNVKNVSNIRKGSNSDGVQNGSQLVGELRSLDKQVIQREADMLRSGKNSGKVVDCYDVVEYELSISRNFIYLEAEAFELASERKLDLVEVQRNARVKSGPHVDKRQTYAITRQHEKLGGAKKLKALGDTSSVVRTIVSTMSIGFENFKFEGERQRQWQIACSFSTCHWTIVLVPLWLWDAIRRDFSVGVYHSHKPNRGLRSIVVLLVHFPHASTELEVEFFSKKG